MGFMTHLTSLGKCQLNKMLIFFLSSMQLSMSECESVCTCLDILFRTLSGIFTNPLKNDGPYGGPILMRRTAFFRVRFKGINVVLVKVRIILVKVKVRTRAGQCFSYIDLPNISVYRD